MPSRSDGCNTKMRWMARKKTRDAAPMKEWMPCQAIGLKKPSSGTPYAARRWLGILPPQSDTEPTTSKKPLNPQNESNKLQSEISPRKTPSNPFPAKTTDETHP
jgi:hypothetical protein